MNTRIGISNRHVHLTREDVNILFGNNYELTKRNDLDQPGQYAANETVTLKTAKNIKEGVRVVGPIRSYTQVEVLNSDKEYFGINPPVRNSDDLDNSEEIIISTFLGAGDIESNKFQYTISASSTLDTKDVIVYVNV